MKQTIALIVGFVLGALLLLAYAAHAATPPITVPQGGTGWGNIVSGTLLTGNGTNLRLSTSSPTYPIQVSGGTISLAFGTTTSNTWAGTQTFTNNPILGSLTGIVYGNTGVLNSVATSTFTPSASFTTTGTLGSLVGGSASTLDLSNTGVTAGTYGNSTSTGQFTVDAQGRLTSAQEVPIAIAGSKAYYAYATQATSSTAYYNMNPTASTTSTTVAYPLSTSPQTVQNWISPVGNPGVTSIPGGNYIVDLFAWRSVGSASITLKVEVWEVSSTGADIALIGTTNSTPNLSGTKTQYSLNFTTGTYTMTSTGSRILMRVIATTSGTPTLSLAMGDGDQMDLTTPGVTVDTSNFVPYTGATAAVNLGSFGLTANSLTLTNPLTVANGGTGVNTFTSSQLLYGNGTNAISSVGTTTHSFSGPFTVSGTIGALVGGTNSTITWNGLATTSQPASSNLLVSNGGAGVYGVATTSVSCSGTVSCTAFTVIGASPITITGSGGGAAALIATSSAETNTYIPFWTSTAATPATLSGGVSGFTWDSTANKLTATNASTTLLSASSQFVIANHRILDDALGGFAFQPTIGSTALTVDPTAINAYVNLTNAIGTPNARLGWGTSTPAWGVQIASSTGPQLALSDGSATSVHWTFRNTHGNFFFATASPSTYATSSVSAFSIINSGAFGLFGFGTTSPWASVSINAPAGIAAFAIGSSTSDSLFSVIASGKTVVKDVVNNWLGVISPRNSLSLQTGTTTTWTATTSDPYVPYSVAPFGGTIQRIQCKTDASFVGVQLQINGTDVAPGYFIASTTVGKIKMTGSNTFVVGDKISANFGTTTTATTKTVSCTVDATETP